MRTISASILIICLLLLPAVTSRSLAQEKKNNLGVRKVGESGYLSGDDVLSLLDNLAIQLLDEPNTHAYMIGYDGAECPFGRLRRLFPGMMKPYLVRSRGIDEKRIHLINGGFREELMVEYWIVPDGATPPSPSPSVKVQVDESHARLFDEGPVHYELAEGKPALSTFSAEGYPMDNFILSDFADVLREQHGSLAYVVIYNESGRKISRWRTVERLLRREMVNQHAIETRRIKTFNGGRRKELFVELWLVPERAALPKLSPTRVSRKCGED